jgi:hypothetical protein
MKTLAVPLRTYSIRSQRSDRRIHLLPDYRERLLPRGLVTVGVPAEGLAARSSAAHPTSEVEKRREPSNSIARNRAARGPV